MGKKKHGRGSVNPIAYCDESMTRDPSIPEGRAVYTTTAVIVSPGADTWMQENLRQLVGEDFHANKARPHEVAAVLAEVAAEPRVRSIVTVRAEVQGQQEENVRKDCLTELARRLSRSDVRLMVMDDRSNGTGSTALNDRDKATIEEAKRARVVEHDFDIKFDKAKRQPLLHAADAVSWQVRRAIDKDDASQLALPMSAPGHMRPQEKMQIVEAPRREQDGQQQKPESPEMGAWPATSVTALEARLEKLTMGAAELAPSLDQVRLATGKALAETRAEEKARLSQAHAGRATGKVKAKGKGRGKGNGQNGDRGENKRRANNRTKDSREDGKNPSSSVRRARKGRKER